MDQYSESDLLDSGFKKVEFKDVAFQKYSDFEKNQNFSSFIQFIFPKTSQSTIDLLNFKITTIYVKDPVNDNKIYHFILKKETLDSEKPLHSLLINYFKIQESKHGYTSILSSATMITKGIRFDVQFVIEYRSLTIVDKDFYSFRHPILETDNLSQIFLFKDLKSQRLFKKYCEVFNVNLPILSFYEIPKSTIKIQGKFKEEIIKVNNYDIEIDYDDFLIHFTSSFDFIYWRFDKKKRFILDRIKPTRFEASSFWKLQKDPKFHVKVLGGLTFIDLKYILYEPFTMNIKYFGYEHFYENESKFGYISFNMITKTLYSNFTLLDISSKTIKLAPNLSFKFE